jgi:hypothetical protein
VDISTNFSYIVFFNPYINIKYKRQVYTNYKSTFNGFYDYSTIFCPLYQLDFDYEQFFERLTFSGEQGKGYDYRVDTINYMVDDVINKGIFLGTGGGTPAFEVTFIQIFHETGIIGLLLFVSLFLWVYYKIIKIIKFKNSNIEQGVPLLIGSICFFIAMGSNPYYGSFDFMWIIFLPIVFINSNLLQGDSQGDK